MAAQPTSYSGPNSNSGLDPDRWFWAWSGQTIRFVLVDAWNAQQHQLPAPRNDYENVHESLIPYLAYELNSLGYDAGGTVRGNREALKLANTIHREIGTTAAFQRLLDAFGASGRYEYTMSTGANPYVMSVEIWVSPGIDRTGDAEFLRVLKDQMQQIWPWTITVTDVNIQIDQSTTLTATPTFHHNVYYELSN